ncbi:tadE-like family protein, partial [Vibrio parahaemolyticus V-223/04]
IKMWSKPN